MNISWHVCRWTHDTQWRASGSKAVNVEAASHKIESVAPTRQMEILNPKTHAVTNSPHKLKSQDWRVEIERKQTV